MLQAGLFSAVTSAFIVQVNSDLRPDPSEETAALLRFLVYKADNTTFNAAPPIPQWTGPPRATVQVQAILFASLAVSLFSAFLAMLGKQWLNRYASADLQPSVIGRCRNRQEKLDGIANWYFETVMELLPVMLQAALLLLGCALSLYLWGINTIIAWVIIGVTSFGLFLFLFIVVAGAVSNSCPYQTPSARLLRRLCHAPGVLLSLFSAAFKNTFSYSMVTRVREKIPRGLLEDVFFLLLLIFLLPLFLTVDLLGYVLITSLTPNRLFVPRRPSSWTPQQLQTISDVNCVSWILRTSLNEPTRLLAMKFLAATTLHEYRPTLVVDCFDDLLRSIKVVNGSAVVVEGFEQLARASALCCLNTLSHLSMLNPISAVLDDLCQKYTRAFESRTDFNNLPFSHILGIIHCVFYPDRVERRQRPSTSGRTFHLAWRGEQTSWIQWEGYRPASDCEHTMVAYSVLKFSQLEIRRTAKGKVPRWALRFVLYTLSHKSMPATSVVAACLGIIECGLVGYWAPPGTIIGQRCVPYQVNTHISDRGSAYQESCAR